MNTSVALLTAAEEINEWAENARRYRTTVTADSIEHATATARIVAYERARNVLRRHASEFID